MIAHLLNPPNWFTAASLFCSTTALATLLAATTPTPEDFRRACILIVFGGIFDLLDGRVARMTRRDSAFGVQLDSIADIVGFGVAPALIAWTWSLHTLGNLGLAATVLYVIAAAFRLARFNVDAADPCCVWPYAGHSRGLTSTMSGGILVTAVWVANGFLYDVLTIPPLATAALVGVLGVLMMSSIPFRHFKDFRHNRVARRWMAVSLSICLVAAVVVDPSMWFGAGAVLYLVGGLVDGLVVIAHVRRRDQVTDDG